jgi:hypothetical protein
MGRHPILEDGDLTYKIESVQNATSPWTYAYHLSYQTYTETVKFTAHSSQHVTTCRN